MARKYSSNPSGNMLTVIMGLIIVAVLALGIFAVSGKISKNVRQNRANSADARVGDLADKSGMELEDYLEQYGLNADSGITAKSTPQEMADKLTLEHYSAFYYGIELTDDELAAFKKDQEISDEVAKDSADAEIKSKYDVYAQAKLQAEQAAQATQSANVEVPAVDAETETAATDAPAE